MSFYWQQAVASDGQANNGHPPASTQPPQSTWDIISLATQAQTQNPQVYQWQPQAETQVNNYFRFIYKCILKLHLLIKAVIYIG